MPRVSTRKTKAKPAAEVPAAESPDLNNGGVATETAVAEPSGSAALQPPSTPVELAEEPKVEEPKVVFTMRVSQKAHKGWATLASDKRKKLAAAFERSIFVTAGLGAKARPTAGRRQR